jgi:hypothetical protein
MREVFDQLRAQAEQKPSSWHAQELVFRDERWAVAWRCDVRDQVDAHRVAVRPPRWPIEDDAVRDVLRAVPGEIVGRPQLVSEQPALVAMVAVIRRACSRCGERLDSVAKAARSAWCAACGLETNQLRAELLLMLRIHPRPRYAGKRRRA